MGGIHPIAIITNQCESQKIALRGVMPDTIHRYCIWHILSKLQQKFQSLQDFDRAVVEFKGIVYYSLTIQTLERKWAELLVKYRLEANEWLKVLYDEREKWIPVYLNHTFWAGMISTQRSEGMHALFDGYVHSMSTLKQFVEQYKMAMCNKIQKEFMADFDSKNNVIRCYTPYPWKRQFERVYTNSIFKKFQNEISRTIYCHIFPRTAEEASADLADTGIKKYKVLEKYIVNHYFVKEFTYTVVYRPNGLYLECNCKSFEFKGIIYCHILKLMTQNDIQTIHERYLLRRWRKDIYRRHSNISFAGGYPHMTNEYKKFQEVEKYFQEYTYAAQGSVAKIDYIKQKCIDIKNDLLN